MSGVEEVTGRSPGQIFFRDSVVDGRPVRLKCIVIGGQTFAVSPGAVAVATLEDEWFDDIQDPEFVIDEFRKTSAVRPDIFTFWQRLPDISPRYRYQMERDDVAALRVTDYQYWWEYQIPSSTRGHVRKAQKSGVIVTESDFTDEFIHGIVDIFNETPVRQGRPFWHFGKDFATVKCEFSRYLFREELIGAYHQNELIGFVMLAHADRYSILGQIISKIRHRDKAPNNALIAKAVEICATRQIPYLVYAHWPSGPLADFKKQNGFQKLDLPRYYVPLTLRGTLALKCGVHHGWKKILPESVAMRLKSLRKLWYEFRIR